MEIYSSARDTSRARLRIAIQKGGRMGTPARELLEAAGLLFQDSRDHLFCHGESEPVDLLLVRDDDIPRLLAEGACDLGIVGRNVLAEYASALKQPELAPREQLSLGFADCRLALAVPDRFDYQGPASIAGLRIATSYPALLADWLQQNRIDADIVTLAGSIEIAPRLGQADLVCDLVSSGNTLRAHGLREVAVLLRSEAVLAAPAQALPVARARLAASLAERLQAVSVQRQCRLLMFNTARSQLSAVLNLLPDAEPPSVMALDGDTETVAIKALCRSVISWPQMQRMQQAGARQLLVLPLEQMLP